MREENKCKYKDIICNHTLCLCQSCYIYKELKTSNKKTSRRRNKV